MQPRSVFEPPVCAVIRLPAEGVRVFMPPRDVVVHPGVKPAATLWHLPRPVPEWKAAYSNPRARPAVHWC